MNTNFPTSFGRGRSQGACCLKIDVTKITFLKLMLYYLTSLGDIYVIYLMHIQRQRTLVNGRSTTFHGINLVHDLN